MLAALLSRAAAFAAAGCACLPAQDSQPAPAAPFDLVLRGGIVIDGSARTMTRSDLGIRDGRIAALGEFSTLPGTPVIELGGLHVAPGFVDVHAHVDADIVREPLCQNFLRMGVTTLITGNCGGSVTDLAAHFARLEKGGIGLNYGSLIGHGTVRTAVLGSQNRAPAPAELARMGDLVEQGMQAGAFGLSTGLIYVPGIYADKDEIASLATVAGRYGGLYASHMRWEGDRVLDAIAEALAIGHTAGVPVHISHVKCTGKPNHGRSSEVLDVLLAARRRGVAVSADQYAYDASSTGLDILFPADQLEVGRAEFAARLGADAAFQKTIHGALLAKMDQVGFEGPPVGITMVLVNGQVAVNRDQLTGIRAGTVLRKSQQALLPHSRKQGGG